jgi:hypothetical protein
MRASRSVALIGCLLGLAACGGADDAARRSAADRGVRPADSATTSSGTGTTASGNAGADGRPVPGLDTSTRGDTTRPRP